MAQNIFRINIRLKDFSSLNEESLKREIGAEWIDSIRSVKSYLIKGEYVLREIKQIAQEILCDPILENYTINQLPHFEKMDFCMEIGYKAGVVDNEARTILDGIHDLWINQKKNFNVACQIFTSKFYAFQINTKTNSKTNIKEQLKKIAQSHLYNPLIERLSIDDHLEYRINQKRYQNNLWQSDFSFLFQEPPPLKKLFEEIPLSTLIKNEKKLLDYSREKLWFFNANELKAINTYYQSNDIQRDRKENQLPTQPTDLEMEVLAQTWSEHCKHKIFAAEIDYREYGKPVAKIKSLYHTYIQATTKKLAKKRLDLISVFKDNSGIFSFTKDFSICMKVETHNSPSALDPFGGAITGILGVNRDIMGTGIGAAPLFNTDVFCFADPFYNKPLPGALLHPRRIFKGVHRGVERGGNESGIPTVNGAMIFDNRYIGKPLVFCGTGGILPKKISISSKNGERSKGKVVSTEEKKIKSGDLIAIVGGRVGKDGIHGATFSSEVLEETSPTSAVQIGDSIMQKKILDFLLEARNRLLYRTLTDNGAGGISSSVGEMATLVDSPQQGCTIHLDRHPTKYPGLYPWEIMVSESQERMTLAVPPENQEKLSELAKLFDVELSFIGEFNQSGYLSAYYQKTLVGRLSLDFMHQGIPTLKLKANWVSPLKILKEKKSKTSTYDQLEKKMSYGTTLQTLLAQPNIASKEFWVRQYDHEVKGISVIKPFDGEEEDAPMDAAVIKPLPDKAQGLVIANGILPQLSDLDTYHMASGAVDESVRNLIAVGGNPHRMVALDNFCWPDPIAGKDNPNGEYKLAQLVRANKALQEACLAYNLPLISGKDSMKNDYGKGKKKISIPPTLLITALTIIDDVRKVCTSNFKEVGSYLYLIGETNDALGGSEFESILIRTLSKSQKPKTSQEFDPPKVNFKLNFKIYQKLHQAIEQELVLTCHDLSDGGLGVALAESCFGGMIGAEIELNQIDIKKISLSKKQKNLENWIKLFAESPGRFIVEVSAPKQHLFELLFKKLPIFLIGSTEAHEELLIKQNKKTILKESIENLKTIWKKTLIF